MTKSGYLTRSVWMDSDVPGYLTTMQSHLRRSTPLWVVVPQVSEWASACGIFTAHDEGGLTLTSAIVGGTTEILRVRWVGCTMHVVAASNYVTTTPAELIASVGRSIPEPLTMSGLTDHTGSDPCAYAHAVHEFFARSMWQWRDKDCGPWRHTAGQLSHSLYRRRHCSGSVVMHQLEEIHELERRGLHAGRAAAFYLGDIGRVNPDDDSDPMAIPYSEHRISDDRIYRLDISSMYPSILFDEALPVAYSHRESSPTASWLLGGLDVWDAVAEVEISSDSGEYPLKIPARTLSSGEVTALPGWGAGWVAGRGYHGREVEVYREAIRSQLHLPSESIYPVGRFRTVLCGVELRRALEEGSVSAVGEVAYYTRRREFRSLAEELYNWRHSSAAHGDGVGERMAKLLVNAFSGKWAQQAGGWTDEPDEIPTGSDWDLWLRSNADGTNDKMRTLGGMVQRWERLGAKPKGAPIIFAAICAHGRDRMRRLRSICPAGSVYQQDTDGLFCSQAAVDAIASHGWFDREGMGGLRIVSTHHSLRLITARHYRCDGRWTLAGVHGGWSPTGILRVQDDRRNVWACLGEHNSPGQPTVSHRSLNLVPLVLRWRPTILGWTVPLTVGPPDNADKGDCPREPQQSTIPFHDSPQFELTPVPVLLPPLGVGFFCLRCCSLQCVGDCLPLEVGNVVGLVSEIDETPAILGQVEDTSTEPA